MVIDRVTKVKGAHRNPYLFRCISRPVPRFASDLHRYSPGEPRNARVLSMRRGGGHKARSVSQLLSRDNEAEEVAESGAAATPSPGPTPAAPARSRRSGLKVMAVVAVILAVIVAVVVSATGSSVRRPRLLRPTGRHRRPRLPIHRAPSSPPPPPVSRRLRPTRRPPDASSPPVKTGRTRSSIQADGRFYLYTSGTTTDSIPLLNVPVASSHRPTHWSRPMPCPPSPPGPAPGSTGPRTSTGSVRPTSSTTRPTSISSTRSASARRRRPLPLGRSPPSAHPFICQSGLSGSIDPRVFTDNSGTNWMLWKSDENSRRAQTHHPVVPEAVAQRARPDRHALRAS